MLDTKNAFMLLSLVSGFSGSHPAHAQSLSDAAAHKLKPGDKIYVSVLEEDALTDHYAIDATGSIQMPLLGTVQLSGLSANEAELFLRQYLQNGYIWNPVVSVHVHRSGGVYVMGAVKNPGHYFIPEDNFTVLKAVALAGGFKKQNGKKYYKVLQSTGHEQTVAHQTKTRDENTTLRSGDVLIVKENFF